MIKAREGRCRRFLIRWFVHSASTFLLAEGGMNPPAGALAPPAFTGFFTTTRALTPGQGLPQAPGSPGPITRIVPIESPGLRQLPAGSPQQAAESSSLDYGLVVLLQLLATPSRKDAVTFRYRVQNQTLVRTFTSQIQRVRRRTSRHIP